MAPHPPCSQNNFLLSQLLSQWMCHILLELQSRKHPWESFVLSLFPLSPFMQLVKLWQFYLLTVNDSLAVCTLALIMSCLGYDGALLTRFPVLRFPSPTDECQVVFQNHTSDAAAHQLSVTVNWRHEKVTATQLPPLPSSTWVSTGDLLNIFWGIIHIW